MNQNKQMILNEHDVVTAWLSDIEIDSAVFETVEPINIYNQWCDKYDVPAKVKATLENKDPNYAEHCINNWNMPEEYKIDIIEHLLGKCKTDAEKDRVLKELILFKERGMIIVLQFLRYLVDVCKEQSIVLGVGRGSSVASYCLYLLGVHKVDSIKYQLDIEEFLK